MLRSFSSSLHRVSLFMASEKPQRLQQIAGTNFQNTTKRAKTMATSTANATDSAMKEPFTNYVEYINNLNDKRERVVKASRDITMNSKKVIFQVHRMSKYNKVEVLEKAEKDLAAVTNQYVSRLVKELQGTDFWKLRRAYSPGIQEYVEAATFCSFCKNGTLLKLDEINDTLLPLSDPSLQPLQINILDYLLGLADLTGELMRLAIDDNSDMKTKMDVMLQSVMKIENACFSVHVRGSEYIPLLGSNDSSSFLVGVQDI
ncbi:unnamed protein product [Vicia faba]|uniref:Translin-associated protein X n=1 Tax=Vicia faba TaxID=3906 RepID=A0AAV1AHH9_VICFA|nr:unnamed protein product [Vicia faba]